MNNTNLPLTVLEIDETIGTLYAKLLQIHHIDPADPTLKYKHLAKVQEELGELAEQLLKSDNLQRKEKGDFSDQDLIDELADTIFTLFYLAKTQNINLAQLLTQKLAKDKEKLLKIEIR